MYFLAVDCTDEGIITIVKLVRTILSLFQWAIPIVLIVLGTVDLGKAVVASKDEEIKKAQTMLVKRLIYAVAIFFVAILVKFIFGQVGNIDADSGATSWVDCWDAAG